jgi:aminoglycoside/choline kinase family phosphotransferase
MNDALKHDFLKDAGWAGAAEETVGEDWSQRHISRLELKGLTAILMQAVPDDDPRATPGHKLGDYIRIADYLKNLGLSVPEIYAAAPTHGLLLVEDFGRRSFHDLLQDREEDAAALYLNATDVLIHLYKNTQSLDAGFPDYYAGHIHTGRRRVMDWYVPALRNRRNEDGLTEEYLKVWDHIEETLPPLPIRFLHIDFHPHNLLWLPQRDGVRKTGLIDFQGGMRGPAPYDLANLLQDARRIVPDDIQKMCMQRFLENIPPGDRDIFYAWYPVLACQFHCRIIGQAIRLAVRDRKTRLLSLISTLQHHLRADLDHPLLKPLRDFFAKNAVGFSDALIVDPVRLGPLIRDDAF